MYTAQKNTLKVSAQKNEYPLGYSESPQDKQLLKKLYSTAFSSFNQVKLKNHIF